MHRFGMGCFCALILVSCGRTELERNEPVTGWSLTEETCETPAPATRVDRTLVPLTLSALTRTEANGNDTYLVSIGFRSSFGVNGSTFVRRFQTPFKQVKTNMPLNQKFDVPAISHPPLERDLREQNLTNSIANCLRTDFFGTLIVAMERNRSSEEKIAELMGDVSGALKTALEDIVENTAPSELLSGANLSGQIRSASDDVGKAVEPDLGETARILLDSLGRPDLLLGFHVVIGFPAGTTVRRAIESGSGFAIPSSSGRATIFVTDCRPSGKCILHANLPNPINGAITPVSSGALPIEMSGKSGARFALEVGVRPN